MSGPGPGSGGPFYFHYVADGTVAFSSACYTEDEQIFSFEMKHDEGQIPVLELEIKNPATGLLGAGRKQWAWFSWWNGSDVVPLFFGRLVGVPSDLFAEVIKVQFIARAPDYVSRKQALAETLKVAPYYDPAMLDDARRNDPDAILEGWSSMFHIDRTTLEWTASDILIPEDGTVTFDGDTALYDNLSLRIGQPPFTSIRVEVSAKWAQVWSNGFLSLGTYDVNTFTGEKLLADWPKPLANIGGGYYCKDSGMEDVSGVIGSTSESAHFNYKNLAKEHQPGDTMTITWTFTAPSFNGTEPVQPANSRVTKYEHKDDAGVIGKGQSFTSTQWEWEITPPYHMQGFLHLGYSANRKRAERLGFTLRSDLQPILTDATVQEESEFIELNTVNLSDPLISPTNWTALAGQEVGIGQVCFPNDPSLPARSSYFICIVAGTCGATEPAFNTTVGDTTTDGSVTWACLGASVPSISDWKPGTAASLGTIVAPSQPEWIYYHALLDRNYPNTVAPVAVAFGEIIRADDDSSFQMAIEDGKTDFGLRDTPFSPTYGVTTNDGSVTWISLGPTLPSGSFHLCVQAGTTTTAQPPVPPAWSAEVGNVVSDGSVLWYSLGLNPVSISIPIGGHVGMIGARSYFTSDRGRRSLEYALMHARAHLRMRSRCVQISFAAPFATGVDLSCRKGATIEDPRIPGGSATGKITSYSLSCSGDSGDALTSVTIGCAVGTGGTVEAAAPSEIYISDGYLAGDYSEGIGGTVLAGTDLGYSPPGDNPNDDGLTFPLTYEQVVEENEIKVTEVDGDTWVQIELKNLNGSSFTTLYEIPTTNLQIPQQINLG